MHFTLITPFTLAFHRYITLSCVRISSLGRAVMQFCHQRAAAIWETLGNPPRHCEHWMAKGRQCRLPRPVPIISRTNHQSCPVLTTAGINNRAAPEPSDRAMSELGASSARAVRAVRAARRPSLVICLHRRSLRVGDPSNKAATCRALSPHFTHAHRAGGVVWHQ